jgi:hypothetical protein
MSRRRIIQVNIQDQKDRNSDLKYWLQKTPNERIEAVEFLRSQHYALLGYKSIPRLVPEIKLRPLKK